MPHSFPKRKTNSVIRIAPCVALNNLLTCIVLSDEYFQKNAKYRTPDSDMPECTLKALSKAEFNKAIRLSPASGLCCRHMFNRLTDAQFDQCVKMEPMFACSLSYAVEKLKIRSPEENKDLHLPVTNLGAKKWLDQVKSEMGDCSDD